MLPGRPYKFNCPVCRKKYLRPTLHSGNTYGGRMWSDGKKEFPMLPSYPKITKCDICSKYFWIEDAHNSGINDNNECTQVRFLNIDEYFEYLNTNTNLQINREGHVRISILWLYNDKVRRNETKFIDDIDKQKWINNLELLLNLYNKIDNGEQVILCSEILRELSYFDKSLEYIKNINEKSEYYKLAKQIIEKCENKESKVFVLKG